MSDDHPCHMEGICTVLVKMFDGMVRELKDVRYVHQLKRNLIFVSALKALGLEVSSGGGIFKMTIGSMVILKGVRHNNLYYLKGSMVIEQVVTSTHSDDDCTRL